MCLLILWGTRPAFAGCGNPTPTMTVTSLGFLQYRFQCTYQSGTSVKWLYGNGATSNSYGWDIKYTYPAEGKFKVRLVQYDSSKSCTDTFVYGDLCVLTSDYFASKANGVYRHLFISANKDTAHRLFTWNFGNGYGANGSLVYYKYGYKNTYSTSLTVYDSVFGCSATTNISVKARRCNIVDTFNFTGSCSNNKVGTVDYANGFNYGKLNATIYWGDFTIDTVQNRINGFTRTHTYSTGGNKNAQMTVKDTSKCEDTFTRNIYVWDTAFNNMKFKVSTSVTGVTLTYNITDSVSKKYFDYIDFGDGSKSTKLSGTHVYSVGNTTFKVCTRFVSKNSMACTNTVCTNINVAFTKCGKTKPTSYVQSLGSASYYLYSTSRAGYSPVWLLGNGKTIYGWAYTYTYPKDGKYDIKLVLIDSGKSCADTFTYGTFCVINADFNIKYDVGMLVQYSAKDTIKHRTYSWDFGNSNYGSGKNVSFKYKNKGMHSTKLTIYDSTLGCSSFSNKNIYVYRCSGVDSFKFAADCSTNKKASILYQNNTIYGYNLKAKIMWGDGNSDTFSGSWSITKSHTYTASGKIDLRLFIKDTSGCEDTLWMMAKTIPDTAFNNHYFGYSFSQTGRNVSTSVVNTYAKSHFAYWEMGDGNTVYGTSNKYTYANVTKNYNLCAVYKSNDHANCTQKSCMTVSVVVPKCSAGFTKYGDTTKKFSMYVVNVSTGKRFHWDFGDGDTSNSYTPKHTYTGLGPYNLCITAYDSACTSTYCDTIGFDTSGVMNRGAGFTLTVVDANGNTGVKDIYKAEHVKVYPNPSSGILHISGLNANQNGVLELYNAQGKKVAEYNLGNVAKASVDVSKFADGWYFVKIKSGAVYTTPVKVIIQR